MKKTFKWLITLYREIVKHHIESISIALRVGKCSINKDLTKPNEFKKEYNRQQRKTFQILIPLEMRPGDAYRKPKSLHRSSVDMWCLITPNSKLTLPHCRICGKENETVSYYEQI